MPTIIVGCSIELYRMSNLHKIMDLTFVKNCGPDNMIKKVLCQMVLVKNKSEKLCQAESDCKSLSA